MGSKDGSEPEDLLVVTRQARLTLFDQANEEEEEDLGAIDWENLIFEIHENIHEASGHGNHEDQSLERAQHSKWFPFKSQQVSSCSTMHAKILKYQLKLPKNNSCWILIFKCLPASLRLLNHWIYAPYHVSRGVWSTADASVSGKCGPPTLEWITFGLTPHPPLIEDRY
jgi:hypothetical protein